MDPKHKVINGIKKNFYTLERGIVQVNCTARGLFRNGTFRRVTPPSHTLPFTPEKLLIVRRSIVGTWRRGFLETRIGLSTFISIYCKERQRRENNITAKCCCWEWCSRARFMA